MSDLDLPCRAIAAGWRWQGGELAHVGRNPVRVSEAIAKTWNRTLDPAAPQPLPDFDDAGTCGVLLRQVRARLGNPLVYCVPMPEPAGVRWLAVAPEPGSYGAAWERWESTSEPSALIIALEAAQEKGL